MVDEGLATPEMIDRVICYGFGRRMGYTGYFKRLDLIGLDFASVWTRPKACSRGRRLPSMWRKEKPAWLRERFL